MKRDLVGTPVTGALEAIMNEREHVLLNPPSGTPIKITRDDPGAHYPQVISPILCEGDVIGAVGATALCESGQGTHLHFAIYVDGNCVDPLIYLPA